MNESVPKVSIESVPHLSTDQMIEVDRAMMEDFHIELIQMMENAGRGLARLAVSRFFGGNLNDKRVIVLAGRGGNGGGALVAARRLHNWGANVQVALTRPSDSFTGIPAHQLSIVQTLGIPIHETSPSFDTPDLILDGLIGYSLEGAPRGRIADLIQWANSQSAPVLALDTPSGIDTASGTAFEPSMTAAATFTLALPKAGLLGDAAVPHVGELYLGDISVPPSLYSAMGLTVSPSLFANSDIVQLV